VTFPRSDAQPIALFQYHTNSGIQYLHRPSGQLFSFIIILAIESMPDKAQHTEIDFLFIGAGAGASLLLMQLEKADLLQGKNILIIDPELQQLTERTFCFWAEPKEPIASELKRLINHQWISINTPKHQPQSIAPLNYFHLSGKSLQEERTRLIHSYQIKCHSNFVSNIYSTPEGVRVQAEKETWIAKIVFDSRPPNFLPPRPNESCLYQSFYGYFIQLENPLKNASSIDLMDFEIDQMGNTQFMYVLPFTTNQLLVEVTRFGQAILSKDEGIPLLEKYIRQRFGEFKLLRTEFGCIPMSSTQLNKQTLPGVIKLGGAAGAIKPSTGYAFKRMFNQAKQIVQHLSQQQPISPPFPNNRFKFYDRLLLLILKREPQHGKRIFQNLFTKNRTQKVLSFLDEQTTLTQDLKLFASLPLKPFLVASLLDIRTRFRHLQKPVLLLLLTLGLLLLQYLSDNSFQTIQLLLGGVGLLLVGIPHGAIDHLLKQGSLHWKIDLFFIAKYLGTAAFYLLFWLFSPQLALALFLLYSAWHFGQTDIQEWQPSSYKPAKSLIWGSTLLAILLLGHASESNNILQNMSTLQISLSDTKGVFVAVTLASLSALWGILEKRPAIVLSAGTLLLSTQLPLLTAFGLYFIGQHSLNGWSHLQKGLNASSKSLFLHALPFTSGAIFLFVTLLLCLEKGWIAAFNQHWVTAFFVFISCISFPHVLAMNQYYAEKGSF
jgi:lycopene beta-cyclase